MEAKKEIRFIRPQNPGTWVPPGRLQPPRSTAQERLPGRCVGGDLSPLSPPAALHAPPRAGRGEAVQGLTREANHWREIRGRATPAPTRAENTRVASRTAANLRRPGGCTLLPRAPTTAEVSWPPRPRLSLTWRGVSGSVF